MPDLPKKIQSEEQLDELLSRPPAGVIELMDRLDGDLLILGIGGKMGSTLGKMASRALGNFGKKMKIIGVSRFSDPSVQASLEIAGVKTLKCDLLDPESVNALPQVKNVIYMAGKKFGTASDQAITWAENVAAPNHVGYHFRNSNIVVFSTGCVYPLVSASSSGSIESDPPEPIGEYAQSCLGRERIFQFWGRKFNIPICLFRLNYAVDLRYGVLHDIGRKVYDGLPVDLSASHFNAIWQGDACAQALYCLEHCSSPVNIINVTGPEILSTRFVANEFANSFGKDVHFVGEDKTSIIYLSNAAKAALLFGYPTVPALAMIHWQAEWIRMGGRSLGKPTHFEVTDGNF